MSNMRDWMLLVEKSLTTTERKKLPASDFALPGRRYPIEDENHARDALSRAAANASPTEKKKIRAKVHSKYPDLKMEESVDDETDGMMDEDMDDMSDGMMDEAACDDKAMKKAMESFRRKERSQTEFNPSVFAEAFERFSALQRMREAQQAKGLKKPRK